MNALKLSSLLALTSLLLMLQQFGSCDHRPKVVIEGGAAPRFNLTGRGEIQVVTVSGPDLKHQAHQRGSNDDLPTPMKPYWEIVPNSHYDLHDLEKSGPLVYGQVPEGFRQNYPANGAAPPALFDGGLFTFQLRIADANGLGVRFTIHEGKALTEGS